jgi:hypothetical protein
MSSIKQYLTLAILLMAVGYGGYQLVSPYISDLSPLIYTLAIISAAPAIAAKIVGKLLNH